MNQMIGNATLAMAAGCLLMAFPVRTGDAGAGKAKSGERKHK